ncbi:MAG TPA: DUF1844 domain-containing protein [Acidobacteriota bacterium]|jgi:hypothetical protein
MTDKDHKEESFKVFDRRKFTITGEERTDLPPEERTSAQPPSKEAPKQQSSVKTSSRQQSAPPKAEPSADASGELAAFLMSLANTAMMYMEAAKDPAAGRFEQNVAAAKQMIDWLGVVQRKTEGNRSAEESLLLENLLYELRMQYLAKNKLPKV